MDGYLYDSWESKKPIYGISGCLHGGKAPPQNLHWEINPINPSRRRKSRTLTSLGLSPCNLNFLGVLLRAYLHPLKYMLQEQPKEKEAPQVLGSLPWHAQVRLQRIQREWGSQAIKSVERNPRLPTPKTEEQRTKSTASSKQMAAGYLAINTI